MNRAIKILVVLLCLPLLAQGLSTIFGPMGMVETYGLVPQGSHGLNTMRGVLGGLPVGLVLMMAFGLWRRNTTWFLAVALVVSLVAFGRLISLGFDGVDSADLLPVIMEIVLAVVMLVAHRRLASEN